MVKYDITAQSGDVFFFKTNIKHMNYHFKNGLKVEGTYEQIITIAKTIKEPIEPGKIVGEIPRGFYISEKNGIMKISDMNDIHIRNALLKQSKQHFEFLQKEKNIKNTEFLQKFMALADKPTVTDLFSELSKRK